LSSNDATPELIQPPQHIQYLLDMCSWGKGHEKRIHLRRLADNQARGDLAIGENLMFLRAVAGVDDLGR